MTIELWMGAEIEPDISPTYRKISLVLETEINECLKKIDIMEFKYWTFIAVILTADRILYSPERHNFRKSRKSFECSLFIDYDKFRNSDSSGKLDLIVTTLCRSIDLFPEKYVIENTKLTIKSCVLSAASRIKSSRIIVTAMDWTAPLE